MHKLACVSVDLDEIDCYAAIHGLLRAPGERTGLTAVYERVIERFARLFRELDIPATFFAIGRDLARSENAARLRALRDDGHEIANHSLHHFYDLTRRSPEVMREEVRGGADAIEQAVGVRPRGFRAPGYTINDALFRVLAEERVAYDSSVFPCPSYYALKTLAIGLIRARGRRSHSVVDHPRVLTAPTAPYRVGEPYVRRGAGLCELPIGVTGASTLRLPYIGTSLAMGSPGFARTLTRWASSGAFVNLELHGIDLADADDDGLTWLAPYQPDLRRTRAHKEACLREAFSELRRKDFAFVTLAEAAQRL
jgi:peptidoglycan/xylan/chitin deacetylase (PgdA/CDA1 family)